MSKFLNLNEIKKEHERKLDGIRSQLVSYRCYGEEKLKKPSVLKGLKSIKSFDLIGKKVNVFDIGNGDLVLYFGTLFSKLSTFPDREDMNMPTSALAAKYPEKFNRKSGFNRFVYPDAWCTIYDRNEGYILVSGLMDCFKELCCIDVARIAAYLYSTIRDLSTKDSRFLTLSVIPTGADSSDYYRFCGDLVDWIYIEERNKVEFNKD